ncbi:MAG: hypothetical protein ABH891_08845 [Candidatus Omnitrophota bacterium]
MFQKNILAGLLILMWVLAPSAYAACTGYDCYKAQLTTYYPIPYGQYTNLKSTDNTYFVTNSGNVGIGLDTGLTAKLEVAQNNAIKIGGAYLSSGGNYAHLATNAWYNGSAWQFPGGSGVVFQLNAATDARVYGHNGSTLTSWAYVNSTSGWQASCMQALKQNIHTLTFADYALLREQFRAMDLFSYNRKDTPTEPEVGFITEHAPDLVLDKTKTGVPLIKGIGYLAVILKAQENVLVSLEKDVKFLEREVLAFGARQQQIEALQKDVEVLREKLKNLKDETGKA